MAGKRSGNTNHARKRLVKKEPFSYKKLTDQQKGLIKWGSIAVLALIVILIVLNSFDLLPHFDGSMHMTGGKLRGANANDIIMNTETRDDPKYFNLGSVEMPEGYYNDEEFHQVVSTSDAIDYSQKYCFRPNDAADTLNIAVVQGSPSGREELMVNITNSYSDPEMYVTSERFNKVSAKQGNEYTGLYSTTVEKTADTDQYGRVTREYFSTIAVGYIDIGEDDKCIMVYLSYKSDTEEEIPTAEEIEARLDMMVDAVTVKK